MLQRIAIYQVIGPSDRDEEFDADELAELATQMAPGDVQLFYQTALIGKRDLQLAPDPRSGAEMCLLRMLAFRPAAAADLPSSGGGSAPKSAPAKPPSRPAVAAEKISQHGSTRGGACESRQ